MQTNLALPAARAALGRLCVALCGKYPEASKVPTAKTAITQKARNFQTP